MQRLGGVAEGLHPVEEFVVGIVGGHGLLRQLVEMQGLLLEPGLVGPFRRDGRLELVIGDDPPLFKVDEKHAARLQAALPLHIAGIDLHHAHLAGHDHAVVVGDVVAARPQAVAVEHGTDVVAVGKRDRGGAVPRLLKRRVVFVEGPLVFRHAVVVLPGFGDHHHHRFLERAAGVVEQLQRVVEVAGVGAVGLDHRAELAEIVAPQVALHHALAGEHPVGIAPQGVDLAIVGHKPAGLGAVPARERVGRKP